MIQLDSALCDVLYTGIWVAEGSATVYYNVSNQTTSTTGGCCAEVEAESRWPGRAEEP